MYCAKDLDTWIIQIRQELMELWPLEVHQTTVAAEPSFVAAAHPWKASHTPEVPSQILCLLSNMKAQLSQALHACGGDPMLSL